MADLKRYGLYALVALGFGAATVGADVVESRPLALTLVLGGSVLTWGLLAVDEIWLERCICGRLLADERMQQIYLRASYAAWFLLVAVMSTFGLAYDHLGFSLQGDEIVLGVLALSLGTFIAATSVYKRRM